MKKLIIIIFACLFFVPLLIMPEKTAKAQTNYAMIISENAHFYSDASCRYVKFDLPYSYYVKIVNVGVNYSRVIYMDDSLTHPLSEGFVANVDLDFSIPCDASPYPNLVLTAKTDEVLFSNTTKTQPKTVLNAGTDAIYYGTLSIDGETYLYVYSQGYVGYVRKSSFNDFELSNHPNEIMQDKYVQKTSVSVSESELTSTKLTDETSPAITKPIQIAIIAVMFVVALFLIYFIIRPERIAKREHSFFNDDNDF